MACEKKWAPQSRKINEDALRFDAFRKEACGSRPAAAGKPHRRGAKAWIMLPLLSFLLSAFLLSACGSRVKDAPAAGIETRGAEGGASSDTATAEASQGDATSKTSTVLSFSSLSEIPDGSYWISVTLTGGSGRASVASPTGFYVKNGQAMADIHWSSAHYDYMKVEGVRYDADVDSETGHARMTIPVSALDTPISVIADTTAMSKPYEIDYTLTFDGSVLLPMEDEGNAHSLASATVEEAMQEARERSMDAAGTEGSETAEPGMAETTSSASDGTTSRADGQLTWSAAPEIDGLQLLRTEPNDAATYFRLSTYEDAAGLPYTLLEIAGGQDRYLLVPENGQATAHEAPSLTVIQQPLATAYVAASATMAPLCDIGAASQIRFSGLRAEGWYVDAARTAMQEGRMLFAGKYSEPDYETLLREGCDLALESTMILRKPEVKEKLESLGIPVYIDYSSYEPHVLGRMEWIRVYGALFGHEKEAEQFYQKEKTRLSEVQKAGLQGSEKANGDGAAEEGSARSEDAQEALASSAGQEARPTVVYFYVNTAGQIQVRQQTDYIPELLEMAGARYLAPRQSGIGAGNRKTNVTVSVEDFYRSCKDVDYLIYSATLDEPLASIDALLEKNPLFADFKAVQEGQVYTTNKDFYQLSDRMADFAEDVRTMLTGGGDMHFLKHVR